MSKNGAIIILNDIKKERDIIEQKYTKQKNKKVTTKEKLIYIFGFIGLFCIACMFFPASFGMVALTLGGYAFGVPFIYSYLAFAKEQKLKKQLEAKNKIISKLEFELNGIQVKHNYIDNTKQFIHKNQISNNKEEKKTYTLEEPLLEDGPKLRLKK